MHLTLRQLHYFIEIVDAGNMTRAAGRLYVAPTALSLQVRAMEERLGVSLLQRHSRGVRPTEAGTELYRKAAQILAMVDETERLVGPSHAASMRSIRFGSPRSALGLVGVEQVLEGSRRLGRQNIQVVLGPSWDLLDQLRDGELDLILTCECPESGSVRHIDLIDEALVFVTCPRDAREGGKVKLAEALATNLAFAGEKGACWRIVHAAARSAGLTCNATQVGSFEVVRHLVRRGQASAILPFGVVEADCKKGALVAHEIADHAMYRRTSLAWLTDSPATAEAGDFVDLVTDVVSDLHDEADGHFRILSHGDAHPAAHAGAVAGLLPFLLPIHAFLESGNVYDLASMVS